MSRPVDLNAARKLRAGRADDGRCVDCGEYRIVCRLTDCGGLSVTRDVLRSERGVS